eukprot:TRINITY_DN9339_c0_g1_i1.p1 TRINITY_DN9339_c0_g1~~TRINITY_DN9339_c0_g1_i1.p1  ORF type:complete len:323 (+),score=127.71 TRINITY_DN9339_c0_g1_i1:120-1088(+)
MKRKQQTPFSVASIIGTNQISTPDGFFSPGRIPKAGSANKENASPGENFDSPKRKQEAFLVAEAQTKRVKKQETEEDYMKLREEFQEQQDKMKRLEEANSSFQKKINDFEKERAELIVARDKLKAELREQEFLKELLQSELASKQRRSVTLEIERNWNCKQLAESTDKLHSAEEEIRRAQATNEEQAVKIESLNAMVEESLFELRSKEQQLSLLNDVIREKEAQLEGQAAKSKKETEKLEKKLSKEAESYRGSMLDLECQVDNLRLKYFVSTVLAIKLNLSNVGMSYKNDVDAQALFEEASSSRIPSHEWPQWIFKRLVRRH